jgi:hypothetical protein
VATTDAEIAARKAFAGKRVFVFSTSIIPFPLIGEEPNEP